MLRYSQSELTDRLSRLRPAQRLAFATACCERLFPAYRLYCEFARYGDASKLRGVIDSLWSQVLSAPRFGVIDIRDQFDSFVDVESEAWTVLTAVADDCVGAVCNAIECSLNDSPKSAMYAASREVDVTDYLVHTLFEIDFSEPDDEASILSNPLMQKTLHRQDRDLVELAEADLSIEWLGSFRSRAEAESDRLLEGSRQLLNR